MDDWKKLYKPVPLEDIPPLTDRARRHGLTPSNRRRLEDANGYGKIKGVCGDTMEVWLRVDAHGIVREVGFMTDGCVSSIACGSAVTSLAKSKTIDELMEISPAEVIRELDGIPEMHCSILAVSALLRALGDYLQREDSF